MNKVPDALRQAWEIGQSDPAWWITTILNVQLYSRSREIVTSITEHDKVAVYSGHGVSKTYTSAAIAIYWALCRNGLVLVTGPKFDQERDIFFGTLSRILSTSRIPPTLNKKLLPATDRWMINPEIPSGIILINSSPQQAVNVQGYHAPRLLFIADEAAGIDDRLFQAFESTQVSRGVKDAEAKMLLLGNPTEQRGCTLFRRAYFNPAETGFHVIRIPSTDSPNVTGECYIPGLAGPQWIEEKRRQWNENSLEYSVRVLGKYWEKGAVDRVFPETLLSTTIRNPTTFHQATAQGLDVARYGDDATVSAIVRDGSLIDIAIFFKLDEVEVAAIAAERHKAFGCYTTAVDETGLGAGVVDILRHNHPSVSVIGVNAAKASASPDYSNQRTSLIFGLRDALKDGTLVFSPALSPDVLQRLYDELRAVTYKITTGGQIYLTPKENIKQMLGFSPDITDAVALALRAYNNTDTITDELYYALKLEEAIENKCGAPVGAEF